MSHPSLRGYSFPMKTDMPVLIRKKLLQKVGRVGERLYRGVEQALNKHFKRFSIVNWQYNGNYSSS